MLGLESRPLLWAAAHMAGWAKEMVSPHLMSCLLSAHTTAMNLRVNLAGRQNPAPPEVQQQEEQLLRLLPVDSVVQLHLAPLVMDTAAELLLLSDVAHSDHSSGSDSDRDSDSGSNEDAAPDTSSDPVRFSLEAVRACEAALEGWEVHHRPARISPAHGNQQGREAQEGRPQQQEQEQHPLPDDVVEQLLPSLLNLASKQQTQAAVSSAAAAGSDGSDGRAASHRQTTRALSETVYVLCAVLKGCITHTHSSDAAGDVPPAAPAAAPPAESWVQCGSGLWQVPRPVQQQAQQVLAVLEGFARLAAAEFPTNSDLGHSMAKLLLHYMRADGLGLPGDAHARLSGSLTACLFVLAETGSMAQRQFYSLLASLGKLSAAMAAAGGDIHRWPSLVSVAAMLLAGFHLGGESEGAPTAAAASGGSATACSSSSRSGAEPAGAGAVAGSGAAVALSKLPALFTIGRSCLLCAEWLRQDKHAAETLPARRLFQYKHWFLWAVKKAALWLHQQQNADVL
jgi:hypothetical protein